MQAERTGVRDLAYSNWHRAHSIGRYVSNPELLGMIDVDCLEYDTRGNPVALVETARWVRDDQEKPTTVLRNLARKAGIPAFVLLYRLSKSMNGVHPDIDAFRVRQVAPEYSEWEVLTPRQWGQRLVALRNPTPRSL